MFQLDEIDKKLLRELLKNSNRSQRELAKAIGVSTATVINHIQRLESAGVIKGYVPVVDPEYFGIGLSAIIAVRISKGKLLETQRKISQDFHVAAIYDVTGDWDSFIIGRFAGREDLNGFIKKLLAIPYVDRTVTHIVLNVVKEEPRVAV